jgi:hypothetical protein
MLEERRVGVLAAGRLAHAWLARRAARSSVQVAPLASSHRAIARRRGGASAAG